MPSEQTGSDREIAGFVQRWYDLLSEHAPVEELLPFVADQGLVMAFPERTLYSHADFLDWYTAVGAAYTDQSHTVEEVTVHEDGTRVDVDVTVVWTAKSTADGTVSSFRINQKWQLERPAPGARPLIVDYRVGEPAAI
ncbi:nuclear transport factor 2 family protein [Streptomyces sp. STR69]|uniref:nuclear transport factor 2 family protein n=1 Tax=Streptomyces sp. STR69 TaxID=1796942 RepID=UPI0021C8FA1A|nr:hypothetical protein [Streptomyces sp. STR69]